MNPKALRHVDLYGPAGRLEALYRELQDPAAIAVICHPLPTGGGTLHTDWADELGAARAEQSGDADDLAR